MKAQIRAKAENIFRNPLSIAAYKKIAANPDVYEYGVDENGLIYFAYLNGIVSRCTKREFLKHQRDLLQE